MRRRPRGPRSPLAVLISFEAKVWRDSQEQVERAVRGSEMEAAKSQAKRFGNLMFGAKTVEFFSILDDFGSFWG